MRGYSYLLFLSSVLAADNNMLAHMAQEQLNIQVRTISLSLPHQDVTLAN
jgi:hypothetical protein